MIRIFSILALCVSAHLGFAQSQTATEKEQYNKPYQPEANAQQDIDSLIHEAASAHKNIIIQVGGNWCIWCLRFNYFIHQTPEIKTILDKELLYYHLNYSPENKNEKIIAKYVPEGKKMGYPYFIILDEKGQLRGLRESGQLEEGDSYNTKKVREFFEEYKTTQNTSNVL